LATKGLLRTPFHRPLGRTTPSRRHDLLRFDQYRHWYNRFTDAIRDEKVLKFKVDYNDVRPQFKAIESEQDEKKLTAAENKQALLHPERIREISQYIALIARCASQTHLHEYQDRETRRLTEVE
jgi:type I site-specific restriction-modification system R (restriction) subunit